MSKLIKKHHVKTVIEVGAWLGKSTRHIATQLPREGKVYAVDHWLGSQEHMCHTTLHQKLPTLYEQFLSNVIHKKLTHKIIPVRKDSLVAAQELRHVKPDLIYIDASHETEAVYNDLVAWFPLVQGSGSLTT